MVSFYGMFRTKDINLMVLILVVVEDGLVHKFEGTFEETDGLILIVVEDGLVLSFTMKQFLHFIKS